VRVNIMLRNILTEVVGLLSAPYRGQATWETRSATSIMVLATFVCALTLVALALVLIR
jgi:hypothetical protein